MKRWWLSIKSKHKQYVKLAACAPKEATSTLAASNSIDISKIDVILLSIGKKAIFEPDQESLLVLYNLKSKNAKKYYVDFNIKELPKELRIQTAMSGPAPSIHAYSFQDEMSKPRVVIEAWLNSKKMSFDALE